VGDVVPNDALADAGSGSLHFATAIKGADGNLTWTPVTYRVLWPKERESITKAFRRASTYAQTTKSSSFAHFHGIQHIVNRDDVCSREFALLDSWMLRTSVLVAVDCSPRGDNTDLFDALYSGNFCSYVEMALQRSGILTSNAASYSIPAGFQFSDKRLSAEQQKQVCWECTNSVFVFAKETGELVASVSRRVLREVAHTWFAVERAAVAASDRYNKEREQQKAAQAAAAEQAKLEAERAEREAEQAKLEAEQAKLEAEAAAQQAAAQAEADKVAKDLALAEALQAKQVAEQAAAQAQADTAAKDAALAAKDAALAAKDAALAAKDAALAEALQTVATSKADLQALRVALCDVLARRAM
jgi:hypothetical protein